MSVKLTTTEIIEKFTHIHGDKYDYSLVQYINAKTKLKIICKTHGIFEQISNNHIIKKQGCPKCSINKKISTDEFIKKSIMLHGEKYLYDKLVYINAKTKIKIFCNKCRKYFSQIPYSHLYNRGCPNCTNNKKFNNIEFINKSNKTHNYKYDYSLSNYINNHTKVKIICKNHGVFEQTPMNHFNQGCLYCSGKNKLTTEEFIGRSNKIHNDKYDYSLSNYSGRLNKVKIICPEHGIFEQIPKNHMIGVGCSCCGGSNKKTTNVFISESKNIHGDKYDYSLVEYINSKTNVKIICTEHGIFSQSPTNHINGYCCPFCKESKGEKKILLYLKENNIKFIREYRFENCRDDKPLPFDFYLDDMNICIEFDGIQHFKPIDFFGGVERFIYTKNHDNIKTDYCENNNIKLIRVKYNEDIQEKMKEICL